MQILMKNVNFARSPEKFALHPLIHTSLELNLVQDIAGTKSGPEAPPNFLGGHFGVKLDVVLVF